MRKPNTKSTKSAAVIRMLSRDRGASIAEIVRATEWKVHSVRAFLTGVRKTGTLSKEQRQYGATSYHYAEPSAACAEVGAESSQ